MTGSDDAHAQSAGGGEKRDAPDAGGKAPGQRAAATGARRVGYLGAAVADSVDALPSGPHGEGSAAAGADGSGPAGWLIKGNADSMLYHPPDSPYYAQTVAEVWFFDEETAVKAGFEKWDKNRHKQ